MSTTKKKLTIKMTRGMAKASNHQTRVLNALGIRKTNQVVEHGDGPTIIGMLDKVAHLVTVKENN